MVPVHFHCIPKDRRRCQRVRPFCQQPWNIRLLCFADPFFRPLIIFNGHLGQRLGKHLQTGKISHLGYCLPPAPNSHRFQKRRRIQRPYTSAVPGRPPKSVYKPSCKRILSAEVRGNKFTFLRLLRILSDTFPAIPALMHYNPLLLLPSLPSSRRQ